MTALYCLSGRQVIDRLQAGEALKKDSHGWFFDNGPFRRQDPVDGRTVRPLEARGQLRLDAKLGGYVLKSREA